MKRTPILLGLLLTCVAASSQDVIDRLRDPGTGFARVLPGKQLEFPRDHAAHPGYRLEWWYLTANLVDRDGRNWGLQWTLFRQALSPETTADGWHSNQIWMAHAAITTPHGHRHEQRFARGGIGQAGVELGGQAGFFNAWLDDWEWRSGGDAMFPARLSFSVDEREIVLLLEADLGPVANGVDGYSQKSAQGQASYYYSIPHLRVRGFVNQGRNKIYLNGQGWLDREWSSQALAPDQQGWDWFSLHLDDGHKLMVYRLRHDDGDHWLSGNWIDPRGAPKLLRGDAIELEPLRFGEIDTGDGEMRDLPMEWRLALPDGGRELRLRALYHQQWMGTRFPYWEGVVRVEDENGERAGIGYMELTGYH